MKTMLMGTSNAKNQSSHLGKADLVQFSQHFDQIIEIGKEYILSKRN